MNNKRSIITAILLSAAVVFSLIMLYLFATDVKDKMPVLDRDDRAYLLATAKRGLDDILIPEDASEEAFNGKYNGILNRVFVTFRTSGRKKGSAVSSSDNLAESVYKAARSAAQDRRSGDVISREELEEVYMEVIVTGRERKIGKSFEPGINGITLRSGVAETVFDHSIILEEGYSLDKFLKKIGWHESSSVRLYMFDVSHFGSVYHISDISSFYRCSVYDPGVITMQDILESRNLAVSWIKNNLNAKGYFNYEYYPGRNMYSRDNNMIRQMMASRVLAEQALTDNTSATLHRKNIEYIKENWYREKNGRGYIYFKSVSKLGAIALALRVLVYSPFYDEYEDMARKLAESILYLQNDDGSYEPWYISRFIYGPGYADDKKRLEYFYSGEASLALLELYGKTGKKEYLDTVMKAADYYLGEYVDDIDVNYYPAYVPWHTMVFSLLYDITGDDRYADAVFVMNDRLLEIQDTAGAPCKDHLGRFYSKNYPEFGSPHSSSDSIYTEGLLYALQLAVNKDSKTHIDAYTNAVMLGIGNLLNLQFRKDDTYYMTVPENAIGGVRVNIADHRIRIDCTQHMADALGKAEDVLKEIIPGR